MQSLQIADSHKLAYIIYLPSLPEGIQNISPVHYSLDSHSSHASKTNSTLVSAGTKMKQLLVSVCLSISMSTSHILCSFVSVSQLISSRPYFWSWFLNKSRRFLPALPILLTPATALPYIFLQSIPRCFGYKYYKILSVLPFWAVVAYVASTLRCWPSGQRLISKGAEWKNKSTLATQPKIGTRKSPEKSDVDLYDIDRNTSWVPTDQ